MSRTKLFNQGRHYAVSSDTTLSIPAAVACHSAGLMRGPEPSIVPAQENPLIRMSSHPHLTIH